ncbi:intradiol ring-cleavage dioxygenase [Massilia sp. G4R7]|uniref:Intradiol ring-cleavage dioxygenase n=1 Tax=Massilia phyllostachyos TaxID=2898585 RepID=A0ABS8Q656_9BURK|nr:intradiol ring-cleavage dioxygenase [Massilia phyllostachyos]MCD2516562.1 intradiol ring-cleavage dioxygenase [Massilia phyllostachyos]
MAHDHTTLADDLATMMNIAASRRQSLRWLLAGAAAIPLAGCGGGAEESSGTASSSTGSSGSGATTTAACTVIPEETGGPYPGDGTNRNANGVANALVLSGIVRSDIRASVAGASGVAAGIPLTIRLQLVNVAANCAAAAGAAVYLWHCTREGGYSLYSTGIVNENYLRGVQEADSQGVVTFQTIFPGCYDGRMPHVHFEVYPTLAKASSASNRVKTSQFAFPLATLNEAYATSGYATSVSNLARISFATDNVFSDGTALQMASVTGNATQGYVATLTVGVSL